MSDLVSGQAGGGPPAPIFRDALSGAALDPARPLEWRLQAPGVPAFELVQDGQVLGEMESAGRSGVTAFGECLGRSLELIVLPRSFFEWKVRVDTRDASDGASGPSFEEDRRHRPRRGRTSACLVGVRRSSLGDSMGGIG